MIYSLSTEFDLPVTAEYRITHPGLPGRTSGPPESCFPPEFEITTVCVCGTPIALDALPSALLENLRESIELELPSRLAEDLAGEAEYWAELRRDTA